MDAGWIKIYREFLDWEWYDDTNMVRLFLHLLIKANFEDKKWHGETIKRGQFVTSSVILAAETHMSRQMVRTCLSKLEKTGEISIKATNKFTLITICKYCLYQASAEDEQPTNNQQITIKQPSNNHQITNNQPQLKNIRSKEINNIKEKINKKEKPSFVAPEFEEVFSVWLEYKHQRRESYKSEISLKSCYNKLYKLADGDPKTAMVIVEQSMANNWAGLFPLKTQINGNSRTTYDRQAEREQLTRGVAATIARRLAEDDARAAKVRGS